MNKLRAALPLLPLTLLAALSLSMACGSKRSEVNEQADPVTATPKAAKQAASGVDLSRVLGINEAIAIPPLMIKRDHLTPGQVGEVLIADADLTVELGSPWVRVNSAGYPFAHFQSWSKNPAVAMRRADQWVQITQAHGLEPLFMLSPWPGTYTQDTTSRYLPEDEQAYLSWVRSMVERYDGDGVDDMPGLVKGIHHWEVDNEPDLKADPMGKTKHKNFCAASEYAQVLVMTSAAIRETDAQAVVLGGGFYRPMTDSGFAYMKDVFAYPGAAQAIDVLSLHVYASDNDTRKLERALKNASVVLPGVPVWITETNQPSFSAPDRKGAVQPYVNQSWQAAMMGQMLGVALREGVQTFFWHTLADAPPQANKRFGMKHHAFFEQPQGVPVAKLIVDTWKFLAARFDELGRQEIIPQDGGIRFGAQGPVLLWSGSASGKARNIVTGKDSTGRVTADGENLYWIY